jgi:2-hydroxychromene-2-carboxylate isomerase
MSKRPPRLYFSFRSPYSWLTVDRLRKVVPDVFESFDCFPYWDPDDRTMEALTERGGEFHYVQMSKAKHLYMLMDTKRIAQKHGFAMSWPVDVDCWWELPHLAWLRARRAGRAAQFYDAITEARWGRGEDICRPEVVRAAAVAADLDPDELVGAATDPEIRTEAVGCLYQAYMDDVFGIPYLKWKNGRFWGLDRVDAFLDTWQATGDAPPSAARETAGVPAELALAPAPYDVDTAGGCG